MSSLPGLESDLYAVELGRLAEEVTATLRWCPYSGFSARIESDRLASGGMSLRLDGSGQASTTPSSGDGCGVGEDFTIPIEFEGVSAGQLVVRHPPTAPGFRSLVEAVVNNALGKVELQIRELALLEELANSWESLNAVYEVSAAAYSSTEIDVLLREILQRVSSVAEGLKVVLWQDADDTLVPLIALGDGAVSRMPKAGSLVGATLASGSATVLNRIEGHPGLQAHPELRDAKGLILLPLSRRGGRAGVLQVWRETEEPFFDTKIVRFLEALATQASIAIENDRLRIRWQENLRLNQEIDIGSRIQQTLLVGEVPRDMPGLNVATVTIPSRRIDGDFLDFIVHSPDCLDVVVGDVMGKGVPAALLAAAVKEQLQKSLARLGQNTAFGLLPQPESVINAANRPLTKHLIELDSFATLCYARFDCRRDTLSLVDCGHPKSIHYRRGLGQCDFIHGQNLPLGFEANEEYAQVVVRFQPGDLFVFYSDGVTEAMNAEMELFGEQRLAETVKQMVGRPPERIVEEIRKSVLEFSRLEQLSDDFTLVVVQIEDRGELLVKARMECSLCSDLNELAKARELVREICLAEPPIAEEIMQRLEVGLTEALSNVIRHAHGEEETRPIVVKAERWGPRVVFRIYHWGTSYSPPDEVPTCDLESEGGMGLYLLSRIFDEITYAQDEFGRNCVRLAKDLREDGNA